MNAVLLPVSKPLAGHMITLSLKKATVNSVTAPTRALENGAVSSLASASSLEIRGSYVEAGGKWSLDVQFARPDTEHAVVEGGPGKLEAIVLGKEGYFRGQQFLSQHMGSDEIS